jgi:hypothetical protein
MKSNTQDFYDIFDYYSPPFWNTLWGKLTIAFIIIFLISVFITFIILKRKKRSLTPYEWVMSELSKISFAKYKKKEEFKKFYFLLTELIKKYFHKRYLWETENKTDEEFIYYLNDIHFDPAIIESLKKICDGALWIKFANQEALKNQAEKDLFVIKEIIEKTKPQK